MKQTYLYKWIKSSQFNKIKRIVEIKIENCQKLSLKKFEKSIIDLETSKSKLCKFI